MAWRPGVAIHANVYTLWDAGGGGCVPSEPCTHGLIFHPKNCGGFIGFRSVSTSKAIERQCFNAGVVGLQSQGTDGMKLTSGGASWSGQVLTERSYVGGCAIGCGKNKFPT